MINGLLPTIQLINPINFIPLVKDNKFTTSNQLVTKMPHDTI